MQKLFKELPLGTRYKNIGGKSDRIYVILDRAGRGQVAAWEGPGVFAPMQGIYAAADSEKELEKKLVEVAEIDLVEIREMLLGWTIHSFREGVEFARGEKMSLQELSARYELSATEITRLLKLAEEKKPL